MGKKLIKEVRLQFKKLFKTEPLLIFSPGRINLIGDHTDYNDGFVFPAAINMGIVLAIGKSEAKTSATYALDKKELYEISPNNINPLPKGGWKNYVIGIVGELKKLGKEIGTFNAVFAGNIPGGSGLSSSAALENSFVYGFNELFGLGLSRTQMILASQAAEHNFVGVKCGIMDQYASMFGVKNSALLLDCRSVTSELYKIDFKGYELILVNTNVKHDLSESAYNERRAVCEKVSSLLAIRALRDATKNDLDAIQSNISKEEYNKALYVINENERVLRFSEAIKKGDIKMSGNLLYKSHEGLSTKYQVSCKELDFLVNLAKEDPNVLGARMMGGGFGGCTINLVKKERLKIFKKEVKNNFKNEFKKECSVYSVKLSKGTRIIM